MGFAAAVAVAVGLGWLAPATHAQARVDIPLTDSVAAEPGLNAASGVDVVAVASQRTVNFSIYPHVEIDGKIHTGVKTVFSYQGN